MVIQQYTNYNLSVFVYGTFSNYLKEMNFDDVS